MSKKLLKAHPLFALSKRSSLSWDVGVAGMREGGKRRLVIPAHMGYGRQGAPPDIPPNSDLQFDVELVKVH